MKVCITCYIPAIDMVRQSQGKSVVLLFFMTWLKNLYQEKIKNLYFNKNYIQKKDLKIILFKNFSLLEQDSKIVLFKNKLYLFEIKKFIFKSYLMKLLQIL